MENLLIIEGASKEEKYAHLVVQLKSLLSVSDDFISNLANCSAALKQCFNFWWVGFYIVKNNKLILGPFQGPIACSSISLGKGVCGKSWLDAQTIIVDDVNTFPGHIACSSESKSEIVVPIVKNNNVVAVLDVDSEHLAHFDSIDKKYLEEIAKEIALLA